MLPGKLPRLGWGVLLRMGGGIWTESCSLLGEGEKAGQELDEAKAAQSIDVRSSSLSPGEACTQISRTWGTILCDGQRPQKGQGLARLSLWWDLAANTLQVVEEGWESSPG